MVTEQQVVVNVEGPTVAGEGARTFFRQHSHVCPEMPLMAPGSARAGATGSKSVRERAQGTLPRVANRHARRRAPRYIPEPLRTFPTAVLLTTSGCAGCACRALCRAEGLR